MAISIAAICVAFAQLFFLYNLVVSYFRGKPASDNPWEATTLEWQTSKTPPEHGNFGPDLPLVYRWAYDYSLPGATQDYIPQNVSPDDPIVTGEDPTIEANSATAPESPS